jgi:hypothetical protein
VELGIALAKLVLKSELTVQLKEVRTDRAVLHRDRANDEVPAAALPVEGEVAGLVSEHANAGHELSPGIIDRTVRIQ